MNRRAVRGFTDQHVPREVLERVLSAAAWSPSGSNLQPWNSYVLTGAPLAELKKLAGERVAAGDPWDEREYEMYPPALKSPYRERRAAFGKERYGELGISREDVEARQRAAAANWADPSGPTSACICRPSCCCSAPKGYTVACRWRGRYTARPLRRSCHPRTGSSSSVACRSGSRTSRWVTPVRPGRRSTRRSRSSRVRQAKAVGVSNVPASRTTSQTATSDVDDARTCDCSTTFEVRHLARRIYSPHKQVSDGRGMFSQRR